MLEYNPFTNGSAGYMLKDLLSVLEEEHGLLTTDIRRDGHAYVLRTVKYPELVDLQEE